MKLNGLGFALGAFLVVVVGRGISCLLALMINDRGIDRHCYRFNGCSCPERDSHARQPRD